MAARRMAQESLDTVLQEKSNRYGDAEAVGETLQLKAQASTHHSFLKKTSGALYCGTTEEPSPRQEDSCESETSLNNILRPCCKKKQRKIDWWRNNKPYNMLADSGPMLYCLSAILSLGFCSILGIILYTTVPVS